MKNLCKKCPNKPKCVKLCEEAEKYANQDQLKKESYVKRESEYNETVTLNFLSDSATLTLQEMINSDFPLGDKELYRTKKANLTNRQYQCIYLYYWKRYKQEEIAKKLNISQRVVSKHLKYAKAKLSKLLKNDT